MDEQISATATYSLREAGKLARLSYWPFYRAAIEGRLNIIAGFREMRVSGAELQRFLNKTSIRPQKKRTRKAKVAK